MLRIAVEWSCALEACGTQYVPIGTGQMRMRKSFAGNLDLRTLTVNKAVL